MAKDGRGEPGRASARETRYGVNALDGEGGEGRMERVGVTATLWVCMVTA